MADDTSEAPLSAVADRRACAQRCVLRVGVGRRVLVAANLRLCPEATPSSTWAVTALARALETWSGPGVVVLAGNLFDLHRCGGTAANAADDAAAALDAHRPFTDALTAFAARDDRRVLCVPGARDPELGSPEVAAALERTGVEAAHEVELHLETAAGTRVVRVTSTVD